MTVVRFYDSYLSSRIYNWRLAFMMKSEIRDERIENITSQNNRIYDWELEYMDSRQIRLYLYPDSRHHELVSQQHNSKNIADSIIRE